MRLIIFTLLVFLVLIPGTSIASGLQLRVDIVGLANVEKELIFSNLSIKIAEKERHLTEERIQNLYQLALDEITKTLESLGYYHAKVTSNLFKTQKGHFVLFQIIKGPPIIIKDVKIILVGPHHEILDNLIKTTPLKRNHVLKHTLYESFKHALLGRALQLGYLDAVYNKTEIEIDLSQNTANIVMELDTGPRYAFGEVTFNNPPYKIDYLKRYIPFTKGEPYTTEQILVFQRALTETDLFSKVRVQPRVTEENNYLVPIDVKLIAKPHNRYTASLGYGTDVGPRGMLGWERKRTNYPGHVINMNIRGSKRRNQVNLLYTIPGKHPITDRLVLGAHVVEEKLTDQKTSLRHDLGVTQINKIGKWERLMGINFLYSIDRELPTEPKIYSHYLLPNVSYLRTNFQKGDYFSYGTRASITLRGGAHSLLSSTDLIQMESRLKWIPLLTEDTRLLMRLDLGTTSVSNFSKLPLTLRFFTGGDQTIRGYGYKSLGPTTTDRYGRVVVVGGKHLAVGSLELERILYKKVSLAFFIDSGNAFNKWKSKLATGAGFGFRYATGLGPLRVDLAWPLKKGKNHARIHFAFGMDI